MGRVKSLNYRRLNKEKCLALRHCGKRNCKPRVYVVLCNGIQKQFIVSRLVAQHFIPNRYNLPEVNHKKGNTLDNRASELEWCTCRENHIHAIREHLINPLKGENHPNSKLNDIKVRTIRERYKTGLYTLLDLSNEFNVSLVLISLIIRRKSWKHVV